MTIKEIEKTNQFYYKIKYLFGEKIDLFFRLLS